MSGQDIHLPFLSVRPLAMELEEFLSRKRLDPPPRGREVAPWSLSSQCFRAAHPTPPRWCSLALWPPALSPTIRHCPPPPFPRRPWSHLNWPLPSVWHSPCAWRSSRTLPRLPTIPSAIGGLAPPHLLHHKAPSPWGSAQGLRVPGCTPHSQGAPLAEPGYGRAGTPTRALGWQSRE